MMAGKISRYGQRRHVVQSEMRYSLGSMNRLRFLNITEAGNWIDLRLVGRKNNRDDIGAVVHIAANTGRGPMAYRHDPELVRRAGESDSNDSGTVNQASCG